MLSPSCVRTLGAPAWARQVCVLPQGDVAYQLDAQSRSMSFRQEKHAGQQGGRATLQSEALLLSFTTKTEKLSGVRKWPWV